MAARASYSRIASRSRLRLARLWVVSGAMPRILSGPDDAAGSRFAGLDSGPMTAPDPIRYLSAAYVVAAMPPLAERLRLAERTMTALVDAAELPPKIGVHPRPPGSFAHAMPALLRGAEPDGGGDLLGLKWIAGFPANRERGIPAIHGLVLLTNPATGLPTAILDAGPITAQRTAAVIGVAI